MSSVKELREIRTTSGFSGDPEEVLKLARPLIQTGSITKAGDEAWDIYEQTLIAAIETSEDTLALTCLTRLSDKFPQSGRVHALRGMLLEVTQDAQETLKFYNNVLDVEPTNVPIIKRRITYTRSLGRLDDAISHLIAYLDIYYSDPDAWAELADIYTSLGQFEKAAFCWSEVVLLKAHDHDIQASYADALLAQYLQDLDVTLLHAATMTYLRSIELCDSYIRGFCGVKVCCKKILNLKVSGTSGRSQEKRGDSTSVEGGALLSTEQVKTLDLLATKFLSRWESSDKSHLEADVSKYVKALLGETSFVR